MQHNNPAMPVQLGTIVSAEGLTKYEYMVIEFTKAMLAHVTCTVPDCVEIGIQTANEVVKQLKQIENAKQQA